MIKINGFKVVGNMEPVLGIVVEPINSTEASTIGFKLVEYYVNEYKTYLNRTIDKFYTMSFEKEEFKKELGNCIRLSEVYIDETVFQMLF